MNFNKYKSLKKRLDVFLTDSNLNEYLKKLSTKKSKSLGRVNGTIAMRHRGGGLKRNQRNLWNYTDYSKQYCILRSIEYDPNKSSYIGTVQYQDGSFSKISVGSGNYVNQVMKLHKTSRDMLKTGDFIKLRDLPKGISIYNVERVPGSGPTYSKAAGTSCYLLTKTPRHAKVQLPSGEEKLFNLNCLVTLGSNSNKYKRFNKKYKAGTNRLLNKRPNVRGVAMNPVDHPHGGGAGKGRPGRPSVSLWGKLTKGVPTRKRNKSKKLILKKRNKN